MVAFLHTAPNLHLIAEAAKNPDLDAALLPIMNANGIKTGDVAGIYFAEHVEFWPHAAEAERHRLLCEWLWTEFQMRADCRHRNDGRGRCIDCGSFI